MKVTELLEKRGLRLDDVDCISVTRQGFLISTFSKEMFDYLEYDGRLLELYIWLPELNRRVYWCVDGINVMLKVELQIEKNND